MVKISPPAFWYNPKARLWPALLKPFAWAVAAIARVRAQQSGWRAPVPVLCCGNISVGGTGKTTVVIDLVNRLVTRGRVPHVLTRGYGGRVPDGTQVVPLSHSAADVGDEPLLLAQYCPVWVGADRAVTARRAVDAGADCLIMDDGLQNPSLGKTFSVVVVDGVVGFGNAQVLPAGPLREKVEDALPRAHALLIIGADAANIAQQGADFGLPVFSADLKQVGIPDSLRHTACVAFAGIGRPEKFFGGLRAAGLKIEETFSFPDHYAYKEHDIKHLQEQAQRLKAQLVTTPKDAMRLPDSFRRSAIEVGVQLVWQDSAAPEHLLDMFLAQPA